MEFAAETKACSSAHEVAGTATPPPVESGKRGANPGAGNEHANLVTWSVEWIASRARRRNDGRRPFSRAQVLHWRRASYASQCEANESLIAQPVMIE